MPIFQCRRVKYLDKTCDGCSRRATHYLVYVDDAGDRWPSKFCGGCRAEQKEHDRFGLNEVAARRLTEKRFC